MLYVEGVSVYNSHIMFQLKVDTYVYNQNVTKSIKKTITTVKGSYHQCDLDICPEESADKQCVANCVMTTIFVTIVQVVQWKTKDIDAILHSCNTLYMKIPETHEYFLLTDVGNTDREYGQKYSIKICKRCWYFSWGSIEFLIYSYLMQ